MSNNLNWYDLMTLITPCVGTSFTHTIIPVKRNRPLRNRTGYPGVTLQVPSVQEII